MEEYIKMRNSGRYDINWFYKHYLENSRDNIDIHTFGAVFNSVDLNNILTHIDHKFKLNVITDRDGNFIKVVKNEQ
jgi:hypothetical protein